MIFCISAVSVVTSPFSFLILLMWVFSLFLLMSLAKGLSILFIFSKNQLFVSLIFSIVFVSISLISAMIFMISFLLLPLVLFVLFSLVALDIRLGCLCVIFLVSWGNVVLLLTSLSEQFLLHVIGFGLPGFHCPLFLVIFWFPLWFLQCYLGYLAVYYLASMHLYFLQIYSCNWYLIS